MSSGKSEREKAIEDICAKLVDPHAEIARKAILNLPNGSFPDEEKPRADINGVILNK